ncbi:hypothetical protein [Campylobacter rectus]|uniref:hypothetical protein n=1 Tax=Campylobacter rectus TaxID=203 RepID=UPI00163ACC0D|nr:hypothetical protein [Campylobacter rectus]
MKILSLVSNAFLKTAMTLADTALSYRLFYILRLLYMVKQAIFKRNLMLAQELNLIKI